ncbi:MAG: hypothetical protein KF715_21535 [Candidatus Didemnitutus sp.]|nr:hypothetical protein [Candidatus Didemnitutus sp.]
MSCHDIRIVAGEAKRELDYLVFARASFGPQAYQASPNYLRWLYDEAPLSRGRTRDFHLAVDAGGRVVGCIHVQRMPWRWLGTEIAVAAPQNTMVLAEHRKSGAGGLLSAQAIFGEKHVLVPGTHEAWAGGMRRLGYADLDTCWRASWLRPVAAGVQLAWKRIRPNSSTSVGWFSDDETKRGQTKGFAWRLWQPREAGEVADHAAYANQAWPDDAAFAQWWNPEVMFWRFFHPCGPAHRVLELRQEGAIAGFAMVSLGRRHGLAVARVVDWRVQDEQALAVLLSLVRAAARRAGAHLLLVMGGESRSNQWLERSDLSVWSRRPITLMHHRERGLRGIKHSFMPSAGDYGFEAIPS